MLRSMYERIMGALTTNRRHKAPRCARRGTPYPGSGSRRLALENLESRRLLTVTTLTLNSISDGNFAAPALAANAYQIAPASSPWTFSGDTGVSANGSAFTQGNPNAPNGTQVAFLKNNASMSQSVYLDAGVYNLSFLAAQRVNFQTQAQEIEVLIDGSEVGLVVPAGTAYGACQTWNFTVAAGQHTVELLGMSPSAADSTAFIDEVAISPVVDTLLNGGFEQPSLPANALATDPGGLPWQFSGTAGLVSNGNSAEAQNAPAGTQAGFVQASGSMSQTVYLDAGAYAISFQAAQGTTGGRRTTRISRFSSTACNTARSSRRAPPMPPTSRRRFRCRPGAHHRVAGHSPAGRRQRGLPRPGVDRHGQRLQRQQLRDTGHECGDLPVCGYRFGLGLLQRGRHRPTAAPTPPATPPPPAACRLPSSRATAA